MANQVYQSTARPSRNRRGWLQQPIWLSVKAYSSLVIVEYRVTALYPEGLPGYKPTPEVNADAGGRTLQ